MNLNIYCLYLFNCSVCSSAYPLPPIKSPCTSLTKQYVEYCNNHGVKLDTYVFKQKPEQQLAHKKLARFQAALDSILPVYQELKVRKECLRIIRTVYCRHYFPVCDRTGREMKEQKLCKATCDYFKKKCDNEVEAAEQLNRKSSLFGTWPYFWEIINCTTFQTREGGTSPECWYHEGTFNGKLKIW